MGGSTADVCWREVKDKDLVEALFEPDTHKFGDSEIGDQGVKDYDTVKSL